MKRFVSAAAAILVGIGALGVAGAAAASDDRHRDRDHYDDSRRGGKDYDDHDRGRDRYRDDDRRRHRDHDRYNDHDRYRDHDRRRDYDRYRDRRRHRDYDRYRGGGGGYYGYRPAYCDLDHDHRRHNRDYYNYYPRDRYYYADPDFSITLRLGY